MLVDPAVRRLLGKERSEFKDHCADVLYFSANPKDQNTSSKDTIKRFMFMDCIFKSTNYIQSFYLRKVFMSQ